MYYTPGRKEENHTTAAYSSRVLENQFFRAEKQRERKVERAVRGSRARWKKREEVEEGWGEKDAMKVNELAGELENRRLFGEEERERERGFKLT